jgi:hypothetical protein
MGKPNYTTSLKVAVFDKMIELRSADAADLSVSYDWSQYNSGDVSQFIVQAFTELEDEGLVRRVSDWEIFYETHKSTMFDDGASEGEAARMAERFIPYELV